MKVFDVNIIKDRESDQQASRFKFIKLVAKSFKRLPFPGCKEVLFYQVMKILIRQIRKIGITERASIISFNIIMAIPPGLMFIISVMPHTSFIFNKFHKEIISIAKDLSPDYSTYLNIKFIINDLFNKSHGSINTFSFFLILFFASNAVLVVIKSFDKSIENKIKMNYGIKRSKAIVITLFLMLLFILLICLLSLENYLLNALIKNLNLKSIKIKNIISFLRIIMSGLFIFTTISLIYKFSPSIKNKWKFISVGAIVASFFYIALCAIFKYWTINYMFYTQRYGLLGTLIIILIFIYIFSFILLFGFELNLSLDLAKSSQSNSNAEFKK